MPKIFHWSPAFFLALAVFFSAPAFSESLEARLIELGLSEKQAEAVLELHKFTQGKKADDMQAGVSVFYRPDPDNKNTNQIIVLAGEQHVMTEAWQKVSYPLVDVFPSIAIEGYVGDGRTKQIAGDVLRALSLLDSAFLEGKKGGAGPMGALRKKLGMAKTRELVKEGKVQSGDEGVVYWLEKDHESNEQERKYFRRMHQLTAPLRIGNSLVNYSWVGMIAAGWFHAWPQFYCSVGACVVGAAFYLVGKQIVLNSEEVKNVDMSALAFGRNQTMIKNLMKIVNQDGAEKNALLAIMGLGHTSICPELLARTLNNTGRTISEMLLQDHGFKEFSLE